jgi:hypothetical protein
MFQLMLSGSKDIATTAEPWIALHPVSAIAESGEDAAYGADLARAALFDFLKAIGKDIDYYKNQTGVFLQSLYDQALMYLGKPYFLDKTPRYYYIFEELAQIFPSAKFIILLRNPLAVLNSILDTWVKDDIPYLANFMDDLNLAPRKLVDGLQKNSERCLVVHYEELVTAPETVLQATCKFLRIEYSKEMLCYGRRLNPDWKTGDPVGVYRFNRPNKESLEKWKKAFKSEQQKVLAHSYLDSLGAYLLDELGYSYEDLKSSIPLPDLKTVDDLVSWGALTNVIQGLTSIKTVRRAAFQAMAQKALSPQAMEAEDEWSQLVKNMVERIIGPKIARMQLREKQLQDRVGKLKSKIDAMENTLSWRITTPLRNNKILKIAFAKYRKHFILDDKDSF